MSAPLEEKRAVWGELLDPIVFPILGHIQAAGRIFHGVGDESELARLRAKRSTKRSIIEQLPIGSIPEHTEVVGIGNQQVPFPVEGESGWLAVGRRGRSPAAEVPALAIEHLDAAGLVDDVEVSIGAGGHCAGLVERAVTQPMLSPDAF